MFCVRYLKIMNTYLDYQPEKKKETKQTTKKKKKKDIEISVDQSVLNYWSKRAKYYSDQ